jgi:hypothetical protein
MIRNTIFLILTGCCLFSATTWGQQDSTPVGGLASLFAASANKFKVDTMTPPNDTLTAKIRLLRSERGWLNINNLIRFELQGQQLKDKTLPKEYYNKLLEDCEHGDTHRLIENVFINLYRQCFTEEKVNQLTEFYKTSAGKKTSLDFFVLSATGASAADKIVKVAAEKLSLEMKKEGTSKN